MNEFTKEELEIIKYWCRENHGLVTKIQSMIDNYCEHEADYCEPNLILCYKCGKELI